ncbi:hypothetical protein TrST_g9592 [Triparma strigata]|uniref:Uncharacterized protein n=1 Tax=Triparma strigata TaxID=1606541 RepID=A0A9W7ARK0_9STRA|nr:hypothetical protein TrST_g9592 [Triparma strigata]
MKSSSKRGRSTSSKNRFKVRSSSPSTSARPTVRVKTIRNPYGDVNVDGNVSTDDFNTEGLDKELLKTVQRAGVVETKHIMKGNIVAIDQENCKEEGGKKIQAEDLFWEVETVMGRRVMKGKVEYLVKWRGYDVSDNTWEPQANLSDTALREAKKFMKKKKEEKEISEREIRRLGLDTETASTTSTQTSAKNTHNSNHTVSPSTLSPCQSSPTSSASPHDPPPQIFASSHPFDLSSTINWSDTITHMPVQRIDITSPDATERVNGLRREGVPVVITNHKGWASFADPWLKTSPSPNGGTPKTTLDVPSMIADIGTELVPVVKKNYNADAPIHGNILASTFLENFWGKSSELYLHQWQFTLSLSAGTKMCNKNSPLPFMGIDLLSSWLDLPQLNHDNPLQYIFMGSKGTFSRLHQDNGGLVITIAPIVGEKEAVMVHRDDHMCLYHGEANVNDPDFHHFPMLANARVWKTTVGPGEILLMPEGTYHQCRNKTDCLSYSRFHLDTLNLPSFIQSLLDDDAPEIDHATILWNACKDLMDKNDALIDLATLARKQKKPCPPITEKDLQVVQTLRTLRHSCRELAIRCGSAQSVIANSLCSEAFNWGHCVEDIDLGLHEFRYRNLARLPKQAKKDEKRRGGVGGGMAPVEVVDAPPFSGTHDDMSEFEPVAEAPGPDVDTSSRGLTVPVLDFRTFLRNNPKAQQDATPNGVCVVTQFNLKEGDLVTIEHQNRLVQCTILRAIKGIQGAFVAFDGFGKDYDELHPLDLLKDGRGNGRRDIDVKNVKVGDFVYARWGALKDVYRAQISELFEGSMVRVHFHTFVGGGNEWDQWVPGNKVIAVVERAEIAKQREEQRKADEQGGGI